ncbi:MAG: cytochrome c oxidase subunit 3 [Gemmatimonadota bacterium]
MMRMAPSPARTGVWVGIAAIMMSFAAYTSALLVRHDAAPDWQHFSLPPILYFNTMLLLASSGALVLARRRGVAWVGLTLALGLLFLAGQVMAWRQLATQGLYLATNPSSSFFYVLTVLHAVHVVGGIVALGYLMRRFRSSGGEPPLGALGAISLYWHFMAVLWLYLLVILSLRL